MSKTLTSKERIFALTHLEGATLSDAYRAAYSVDNMKPETVNRRAFDVANRPRVKAEIDRHWAEAAERANVTCQEVLANLRRNYELALDAGKLGEANRATELLGKTIGMFSDRAEVAPQQVFIEIDYGERNAVCRGLGREWS